MTGALIATGGSSFIMGSGKGLSMLYNLAKSFLFPGSYTGFGLMERNVMVGGLHVGKLMKDPANKPLVSDAMEHLVQLFKEEKIKPVIDSVWHFEQVGLLCSCIHPL